MLYNSMLIIVKFTQIARNFISGLTICCKKVWYVNILKPIVFKLTSFYINFGIHLSFNDLKKKIKLHCLIRSIWHQIYLYKRYLTWNVTLIVFPFNLRWYNSNWLKSNLNSIVILILKNLLFIYKLTNPFSYCPNYFHLENGPVSKNSFRKKSLIQISIEF